MSNNQSKTVASQSAIASSEHVLIPAFKSHIENKVRAEAEARKAVEKTEPSADSAKAEASHNLSNKSDVLQMILIGSQSAVPAFKKYLESKGKTSGRA